MSTTIITVSILYVCTAVAAALELYSRLVNSTRCKTRLNLYVQHAFVAETPIISLPGISDYYYY